jgi:trehalose 6-phosphate synthase
VPIHYQYGEWDREELLAHYRACGVALVTPLKDGMNLVAKEYCASRLGGDGVLVLSEHAGAAAQLQEGALLVNPYDVEGLAEAIRRAVTMPGLEQRQRMSSLRRAIRRTDLAWWVRTFLAAAEGEHLGDDARVERFSPRRREGPPGRRRLGERYASSSSSSSTGGAP